MSIKDDGGPAFPQSLAPRKVDPYTEEELADSRGMSLRDWFAGRVLQALVSNPQASMAIAEMNNQNPEKTQRHFALRAYQIADAMLAERYK